MLKWQKQSLRWTEYHTYHHYTEPKQLYKHLESFLCECAATSACKRCINVKKTQLGAIGLCGKEDLQWTHQCYTSEHSSHKRAVHHIVHPGCLNLPCVCYTALQLRACVCVCVCVCMQQSLGQTGLALHPLVTQQCASETCWFLAPMPHGTSVHVSRTNWFTTVYMLLQ